MNVNPILKNYIEQKILPLYKQNYIGDNIDRIDYVLNRSKTLIEENQLKIDENMLYVIVAFHDLRDNNEEKNHEIFSAKKMMEDEKLKEFFTEEQRNIMKMAIEDQRANKKEEPRNIYGKILSSASRNISIDQTLKRSYLYGKKLNPEATDEEVFAGAYSALQKKFGENGYAKFYFKDQAYETFLKEIRELLKTRENFINTQKEYIQKLRRENKCK